MITARENNMFESALNKIKMHRLPPRLPQQHSQYIERLRGYDIAANQRPVSIVAEHAVQL